MYNPNYIIVTHTKPVNFNISPRRGMRRDIESKHFDTINDAKEYAAAVVADGFKIISVRNMFGKEIKF